MTKIGKTSLALLLFLVPGCQTGGGTGGPLPLEPALKPDPIQETKPGPDRAPRILVTNDDGIDAPGLGALVLEMAKVGEVVVVAPANNRSGSSHSISTSGSLVVEPRNMAGAKEAWAVSGTPADAVSFGIIGIGKKQPFDLVVSGVNRGSNVGLVAHYSGTVGAAMEAGIGYNINIPPGPAAHLRGVAVARMGGSFIDVREYLRDPKAGANAWQSRIRIRRDGPAGSDTKAYYQDMITVVPIRLDWTDKASVTSLREWKWAVQ